MSNLPGNPHVHAGPQIAHPDWINESFIAEQGETVETVFLSELARNTEAILAVAYEQRTANLIAVATAVSENGVYQLDPALIGAAQEEIASRLGLGATK